MNKNLLSTCFVVALALFSCKPASNEVSIIPIPVEINLKGAGFTIKPSTRLIYNDKQLEVISGIASELWMSYLGFLLEPEFDKSKPHGVVLLKLLEKYDETLGEEGYKIEISKKGIEISANKPAGILYGSQTVCQLLSTHTNGHLPGMQVTDYPRFGYRGLHLDVSRHFMPVEFIYQLLDHMAMHKLNTFHWHLVDDQGWRLEIMKYPKLTEIGAWRVDMSDRHWNDRPVETAKSGPATYGGFYTQEEVRAIVAYALERNITVMPEIEMPAHVMSALAAYPEYSCTGKNLGVPPGGVWPITHIYCAGNDATFEFLENILLEVMDLFPSEFIHIGGDEADKTEWNRCKKCQGRIRKEGLKDENELQSYFIKRIERFLNEHDRILVGWDEILEGGLAPNAVVMSWRGEEGGIEAARMGNRAIMTPGSHCYFDHYQGDPAMEPLAFGGFTTLQKVYHYEPIPNELTEIESKFILGAQANVWTEYMPTSKQVEYMVFPRLAALAEVVWSPKEKRNWVDFLNRMEHQYLRYQKLGINYSRSANQVSISSKLNPDDRTLTLTLETQLHKPEIRYSLDGSRPTSKSKVYKEPFKIDETRNVSAAVFKNGDTQGEIRSQQFIIHKAFAKEMVLEHQNSRRYDGQGQHTLVNGVVGSSSFSDGNYKGFLGDDLVATIDLGIEQTIEQIRVYTLQNYSSWIFFPTKVNFEVSADGTNFAVLETVENEISPLKRGQFTSAFETKKTAANTRFVRITASNIGSCPAGHPGESQKAWLFVSEIVVD